MRSERQIGTKSCCASALQCTFTAKNACRSCIDLMHVGVVLTVCLSIIYHVAGCSVLGPARLLSVAPPQCPVPTASSVTRAHASLAQSRFQQRSKLRVGIANLRLRDVMPCGASFCPLRGVTRGCDSPPYLCERDYVNKAHQARESWRGDSPPDLQVESGSTVASARSRQGPGEAPQPAVSAAAAGGLR